MNELANLKMSELERVSGMPLLLKVDLGDSEAKQWCDTNAAHIDRLLDENGVLLIRGLTISGSKKFASCLEKLFDSKLLEYKYRSTPRTRLRGNVYTSTEYHCEATIVQHNECAYANEWPLKLGFVCLKVPECGGETPVCDSHLVYQSLPEELIEEFKSKQLMYVRNYSEIDLPWTEVFQTKKQSDVDRYCKINKIEREWKPDGSLKTWQVSPAVVTHPISGLPLWFNQAHLFHLSALSKDSEEHLRGLYTQDNYPRHVYFGDGSEISDEFIALINKIYRDNLVVFPWQENDFLLVDNMRFTHGRLPFKGERKVLVGMAHSYS